MTQEEKQLLFKDLCARLSCGVKILDIPANVVGDLFLVSTTDTVEYEPADETNDDTGYQTLYNIKPYLRPMSSMTEEENLKLEDMEFEMAHLKFTTYTHECMILDYLYSRHLDVRGLIPMGLALEAPEDMYKTE